MLKRGKALKPKLTRKPLKYNSWLTVNSKVFFISDENLINFFDSISFQAELISTNDFLIEPGFNYICFDCYYCNNINI